MSPDIGGADRISGAETALRISFAQTIRIVHAIVELQLIVHALVESDIGERRRIRVGQVDFRHGCRWSAPSALFAEDPAAGGCRSAG